MNRYFTCNTDAGRPKEKRRVVVFVNGAARGRSYWRNVGHSYPIPSAIWDMGEMADDFTEVNEQRARFILGQLPLP
jgi:hypothetical protein